MEPLTLSTGQDDPIYTVQIHPNAPYIATGGCGLNIWDASSLLESDIDYYSIPNMKSTAVTNLKWSPGDDEIIYAGCSNSEVYKIDMNKGAKVKTFEHSKNTSVVVNEIDVLSDGSDLVCSVGDDGKMLIFDSRSKDSSHEVSASPCALLTAKFGRGKSKGKVYCSGIDPNIQCLDLRDLSKPLWEQCLQKRNVASLDVSNCGEYIISRSIDGSIKYLQNEKPKPYVFDHGDHSDEEWIIRCQMVSSRGGDKYNIVTGGEDSKILGWDLVTRKVLFKMSYNSGSIYEVHCQGNLMAAACQDGTVILTENKFN